MQNHATGIPANEIRLDAVVVGAGFGGIYALKKLRDELGLNVLAFDKAGGVGGTWYWNRYPGALSDSETHVYCYSWDKELWQNWHFKDKYVTQEEVLRYLRHVVERHDLARDIRLNTGIASAHFDDKAKEWIVTTDTGQVYRAKYFVTSLGLLAATNIPDIPGISDFKGEMHHTSRWPDDVTLEGKRIGVIGTGSTGVQFITATAPLARHLTVFQRSPQYSVPIGNGPLSDGDRKDLHDNFDAIWEQVKSSRLAFGFEESDLPLASVTPEERKAIFDKAWEKGGGFRFMFETFSDIALDEEANLAAQDYIRGKIDEIVTDPETARKLKPTGLHAKRPLCDTGYYDVYNRPNVSLVHIGETPIARITANGILTEDGAEHELDMIVFATGFDAVDGNYKRMDLRGRDGIAMSEHWREGPTSYMSVATANFPNMFMVLGPHGPFTNLPPTIEAEVEWISDTIGYMENNGIATIEPEPQSEVDWIATCQEIADMTLFPKAESWIFGANIPGKKNTIYFYMGGLGAFRDKLREISGDGYRGFTLEKAEQDQLAG
jgi:cation diffusion facilitator CzcD-associated flavoprotein CzcO